MKLLRFRSLRSRYSAVAATLTLVVLAGSFIAHQNVTGARRDTTANIEARGQLLELSRYIRDSVWRAREALESFLLDPQQVHPRKQVHQQIQTAIEHTETLLKHRWVIAHRYRASVKRLELSLQQLDSAAKQLIETRLDLTKQYPALALARGTMLRKHRAFLTAATQAMDETLAETPHGIRSVAYRRFVEVRYLWNRMISTFRMHLANRLGSFNERALPVQQREIETEYRELRKQLNLLEKMQAKGKLGFQAGISVDTMNEAAEGWHEDFQAVKRIHNSGEWRADKKQLSEKIEPLLEQIWNLLLSLDTGIESSANLDVRGLTRVAQTQSRMVWLLTALGLVLITIGSIALERWVLRPIATVADALKKEAVGGEISTPPIATLEETRNLVDAFAEMRKQVHSRQVALEHQALHDALTDLPNRCLLRDRLQQAIYASRRSDGSLALLMMDLDRFKEINDTLGHHVGDQLLKEVGARLLGMLRETDTVARLGGDEFAVLLPNTSVEQATHHAANMLSSLAQVFRISSHHLHVGASVGIAMYPQHGEDAQTLIQRADVAMYVAKRSRIGHAVYDPREDQHSVGRLALMSDLYNALDENALELHYQPKVRFADGQAVGVEALLRWHHPKHGWIAPDEIIPLAEQTGLIKPLTLWVLSEAIQECRRWLDNGIHLSVAVNLSVYNLQDADIANQIEQRLSRHQLPAEFLVLEITESAMLANPAHAAGILSLLDKMGVRLAIDDFGTGYSSLAYLKQLPVDELKIDKSFVLDMADDENDAVIVRSTIDLAHNLGLTVVAEGVENQHIWEMLEILRCDQAQGYYMSRPVPGVELLTWLRNRYADCCAAHSSEQALEI